MKVAFCFSGQPRDVKNTLENIKQSWATDQDVDFFFHSWWGQNNVPFRDDAPSDVYTDDLFDYVIETLNPVDYLIEKPIEFKNQYRDSIHWPCYNPRFNQNPSQNIQSQFYSNMKSNQLRLKFEEQNNLKYDAVVKCRFDYLFTKKYKVKDFDLSKLNIKNDCKHTEYAINDHVAVSNGYNMNLYCNLFDNLEKYYNMGIEFNPEVILGYHMKYNNVEFAKTLGDNDESYVSTKIERSKTY